MTSWTIASQAPLFCGILQARILERVVVSFSWKSSQPMDRTCITRGFFTIEPPRKPWLDLGPCQKHCGQAPASPVEDSFPDSALSLVGDAMGQSKRQELWANFLQGCVVFWFSIWEVNLSTYQRRILKPDCVLESVGGMFLFCFQTSSPWTHPCASGGLQVPCNLH